MAITSKSISDVTIEEYKQFPVWEFTDCDEEIGDETWAAPVTDLPVSSLPGRLIATEVCLNNGIKKWAVLGNISLNDPVSTVHFITVSLFSDDDWFELARYQDSDYERNGPSALAAFLGLEVDQVFPIRYDISALATGDSRVTQGVIPEVPAEKLSRDELTSLAIRSAMDAD